MNVQEESGSSKRCPSSVCGSMGTVSAPFPPYDASSVKVGTESYISWIFVTAFPIPYYSILSLYLPIDYH